MAKYQDPAVKVTCPDTALQLLKDGNARFVANGLVPTDHPDALKKTGEQQSPFASILTCADSRCSPEIYFDQGIGNIFVVRNAGNFADREAIGSFQFAENVLGSQCIVVVGHTQCGAIKNAHAGTRTTLPELDGILIDLEPIVKDAADWEKDGVPANVKAQVEALKKAPGITKPVHGCVYCVASGKITWL
ncbi:MAG: hypothetical protein FWD97_05235 [Defluviitaleaceae bacterium]|nr:hypothetical protein [Defluviitaleaceae bacterium]